MPEALKSLSIKKLLIAFRKEQLQASFVLT